MKCHICPVITGIEEHHLWSKCFDNKKGLSFDGNPSRVWLCRKHHEQLEAEVIIPILQEVTKKKYKAEYYLWKYVIEADKRNVIERIVKQSWRWLDEHSREA